MHSVNVPRGPGMGMLSQPATHVTKQAFLRQRHFCLFSLSLAQTTKPQLASRDGPVAAGLATTTSPVGFDSGRTAWAGIFEARSFDCKDISIFPPPPKKAVSSIWWASRPKQETPSPVVTVIHPATTTTNPRRTLDTPARQRIEPHDAVGDGYEHPRVSVFACLPGWLACLGLERCLCADDIKNRSSTLTVQHCFANHPTRPATQSAWDG